MSRAFTDMVSDDAVTLHTQYSTQWDSLAHMGGLFDADGDGVAEYVYYNGFRADQDVVEPRRRRGWGASARYREYGHGGRARARSHGGSAPRFGWARTRVGYDDLMRCMENQRAEVGAGDFLCLRTGLADLILSMNKHPDPKRLHNSCAALDGRDEKLLQWIDDSGLVAICADNFAVEAWPTAKATTLAICSLSLARALSVQARHSPRRALVSFGARGMAEAHGRSRFLLTAPPLSLPGSVGSPVTPIATV